MRTHAVFLRLQGRRCVVVGGDAAAESKVRACLESGGEVTVVAPALDAGLAALAADGRIRHVARAYRSGDLAGAAVAYAAVTDDSTVFRVRTEATDAGVLLNVVDRPDACDFLAPAVVRRGDLQVAVGTGGASPGLAARVRRRLEALLGPEYGPFVAILGAVRRRLSRDPRRVAVMDALLESPLLETVRHGRPDEVDRVLGGVVGAECTLAGLGVSLGTES